MVKENTDIRTVRHHIEDFASFGANMSMDAQVLPMSNQDVFFLRTAAGASARPITFLFDQSPITWEAFGGGMILWS